MAGQFAGFAQAMNALPRRVEGGGFIRWYVGGALVARVTTKAYYRDAHVHPHGCECNALIHDDSFQAVLRKAGEDG